jgi:valine dehydrogenase (NAD+)
VVTDVSGQAVEAVHATFPQVDVAPDAEALVKGDLDVYAPCALGGALDASTVECLSASIVCGAANNQLVDEGEHGTAQRLLERGITYAPDFLVNAGGVIQVSDELHGFSFERARAKTARIFDHTGSVLRLAAERGISPAVAADRIAEERMSGVGTPNRIWLPAR